MKIMKLSVVILILLVLTTSSSLYAANSGNTSDPKLPRGDGITRLKDTIGTAKLSFDADAIIDRELEGATDVTNAEMEGEWYILRIGYPLFDDRFEPYVGFGVSHLEASWTENTRYVSVKGDNDIAWAAGARWLAYEIPEYKVKFTVSGHYRSSSPDIDRAIVNVPSRSISTADFRVQEWQIGAIASIEFPLAPQTRGRRRYKDADIYSLVPYIGVGYSDAQVDANFTDDDNLMFNIGNADSDQKAIFIAGCDLLTPSNAAVNIEGRFVGETAVSGGATIKF